MFRSGSFLITFFFPVDQNYRCGDEIAQIMSAVKIKKILFIFFFDVFVYHFNGFIGILLVAQLFFSSFNSLLAAKWSFFGTINLTSVY